jgi:error-prone DNA polymerase
VGRALGFDPGQLDHLSRRLAWWDGLQVAAERVREAGLDPDSPRVRMLLELANQLVGFPRHLSQHVGGFVISRGPLAELVPVENAAMAERTVIQWDKDDLETLGLLKVDVLALGMLSAIRRSLALVSQRRGQPFTMADIPREHPAVYDMLCQADAMGVFQVESRAQMSMLPRLGHAATTTWWWKWPSCGPGRSRAAWSIPTCRRGKSSPATSPSATPGPRSSPCSAAPTACRSSRSR